MKTTNQKLELCSALCRAMEYADRKHAELVSHDAARAALAAASENADEIYADADAAYRRAHLTVGGVL